MNITIICMGKLKEQYLRDACAEYIKRLSAFCKAEITELAPARLPDEPSAAQIEAALEDEAKRIAAKIPRGAAVFALCIEGRQYSSPEFSAVLQAAALEGGSNAVFVIGSSFGLSESIKKAAKYRLSMSEMTFPHQLARVMLLEQLYRGFQIAANGKYHK